jgi:hypothetical protein
LSDNAPIQPGETKDITLTVQDARWDTERLSGLAYDVDSSFAGVLFFFTASGTRYPMEVGGPVIPAFEAFEPVQASYSPLPGEPTTPVPTPKPKPPPPTPTQQ